MKARHHIVVGGIASAALVPALGINSAAFFASTVLIDFDHYVDYVCRNGFSNFSVRRMFTYVDALDRSSKNRPFVGLSAMHTVEFLLLVYVVAVATGLAAIQAVLWGLLFHMMLDIIYLGSNRMLFDRAFSVVEFAVRWRRLRRWGLRPDLPYRLALEEVLPASKPARVGGRERTAHKDRHVAKQQHSDDPEEGLMQRDNADEPKQSSAGGKEH